MCVRSMPAGSVRADCGESYMCEIFVVQGAWCVFAFVSWIAIVSTNDEQIFVC